MDFTNSQSGKPAEVKKIRFLNRWLKRGYTALLFSGTGLIIALVLYLALSGPVNESKYIKDNQFQAITLTNGQAYFGRITNLNAEFVRIGDVFYLRQNQNLQSQKPNPSTSNLSLVKLGCELHGPDDEIVIGRDQLVLWENLKNDSAVVKKIAEFKQQNPDGQKCSETTSPTTPTTAPKTNNSQ